jgi:uncharacterized protein
VAALQELKIIFAGPMGAGKTTAIRATSDLPPVSTEVPNTDQESCAKETTTVALGYGQLALDDATVVRLYGTPGQERFSFMWSILAEGALGVIVLIDGTSETAQADLTMYANQFKGAALVIGVGRLPLDAQKHLDRYSRALTSDDLALPIFSVDVRKKADVLLLVNVLLGVLEARDRESDCESH